MNFKQITAFHEVMLTGSVSAAARNLNRTQPAISALISSLESDTGFPLFSRMGGRLRPVPEAHYLFAEAGEILARLNTLDANLRLIRKSERGSLRVVAMPGPSVFLLPELIANFTEGREGVRISLNTHASPHVQQLISVQKFDVGLGDIGFPGVADSPLVNHDVWRLDSLCAVPACDPLAAKAVIRASDLDGRAMATLLAEHSHHLKIRQVFEEQGVALKVRFETQHFLPLFTFVERGLACALVDPLSAESYRLYRREDQRIAFRPFEPNVEIVASIMTPAHQPLSTLARAFVEELNVTIRRVVDEAKALSR